MNLSAHSRPRLPLSHEPQPNLKTHQSHQSRPLQLNLCNWKLHPFKWKLNLFNWELSSTGKLESQSRPLSILKPSRPLQLNLFKWKLSSLDLTPLFLPHLSRTHILKTLANTKTSPVNTKTLGFVCVKINRYTLIKQNRSLNHVVIFNYQLCVLAICKCFLNLNFLFLIYLILTNYSLMVDAGADNLIPLELAPSLWLYC